MALTFLYRDLDATDTDVTPYVVLRFGQNPQGMAENAEERSVGAWDLEIEDNGVLDLHAQRTFYVLEDDTDYADNVLWVGQTFDKHSVRGDTWRTGLGRVYTLSLIDLNTLLERRVIQAGDDPDRPEETDVERMLWLQGLGYIGVTDDWISTADPVDMDAVDYTGRMASEVMEDCMQQSTKNGFMFRDPDADTFAVFYGDTSADTDVLTSDIRLSNVLSDIDNVTTFEVNLDADQWEANSRIYSGIFGSYDGGGVYVENATTVANFSHRDTTLSWPDVKTATKATARAMRQLAIIGTQEYRITTALEVGSNQVGLFPHAGYRLQARFSHFPLFADAFTWFRILSRNTTLIGPNRYRIQYELSPGTAGAAPVACPMAITLLDATEDGPFFPVGTPDTQPPDPDSYPSVVIVGFAGGNGTTGTSNYSIGSDYTVLWPDVSASPLNSIGGYVAVPSGSPPLFTTSTAAGDLGFTYVRCRIRTAATDPVQTASQLGTGGSVVFGSTPTPGNIIIAYAFDSLNGSSTPRNLAINGWTLIYQSDGGGTGFACGGLTTVSLGLWARCVEEGDDGTYGIAAGAFSHWTFCSEWELT